MKKAYIKPIVEIFPYSTEEGFAKSVFLHSDFVLIESGDNETLRASDEVTEFTDGSGEYDAGYWE